MAEITQEVSVEQCDRDAAAKLLVEWKINENPTAAAAHVRNGTIDDHPLVQAFARHRLQALEAAAKLCEDHGHSNGRIRGSHKHLAAAIRALGQG